MPARRTLARPLLLAALCLAAGCMGDNRGPDTDLDGVLVIVVDTLRADRLGAYGHERPTSPVIDDLAARGLLFEQAMTPVPVTLPAFASLLTGQDPPTHGVRDNDGFVLPDQATTLSERFAAAGWRTGAILAAGVVSRDRGLDQGFGTYDDAFDEDPFVVHREDLRPLAGQLGASRRRADVVTRRARRWLEEQGRAPYFLLVHYFDVHAPYDPPPAFATAHPDDVYDGAIAATDAAIGELLASVSENTLIVLVADHGEGLDEHGESEHGFLLYQSTLHVPMIIAGPGVTAGRVATPVSLIDLAPTLADRCQLSALREDEGVVLPLNATSALPARNGLYAETLRPLLSYGWQELRALRDGPHKLIRARSAVELYDLSSDPGEQRDLLAESSRTRSPLADDLNQRLERKRNGEDPESVRAAAERRKQAEPERAAMLQSLGYLSSDVAVPPGERPHPREALPRWVQRQRDKARIRLAGSLIEQGRPGAALELIAELEQRNPQRADLLFFRGSAQFALGDTSAALDAFAQSLVVDPIFPPTLDAYSEQLLRRGEIEAAIPLLTRLARVSPDDADAHYNLGVALQRMQREKDAARWLQSFVRLAPEDPRAVNVRLWLHARE